jgi:hypothetical protein
MRVIFEATSSASINDKGTIRVELTRTGLPTLSDERTFCVVPMPPGKPATTQIQLPPFNVRPINPENEMWTVLEWPTDIEVVASSAEMDNEMLVIYYSTVFPKFADRRANFERRDPALASSFTSRYEVWLAVHSLLLRKDQEALESAQGIYHSIEDEQIEAYERSERCRIATLASLFAARETEGILNKPDIE